MQLCGQTSVNSQSDDALGIRIETVSSCCRFLCLTVMGIRDAFNRIFTAVSLLLFCCLPTFSAEVQPKEVSDSIVIHFPQSHSTVSPLWPGNTAELNRITDFIHRYNTPASGYILRSVRVIGGASPEGSISINERLSRGRAQGIYDYLFSREEMPDSVASFLFLGRDWQGLRDLVFADDEVPYRDEVLTLIDNIIGEIAVSPDASDKGLSRLRALHHGEPYRYMYNRQFPALRASKLLVEYEAVPGVPADTIPVVDLIEPSMPEENLDGDSILVDVPVDMESVATACKPFYMDLRTNMLYDALALPTIGAEFYVGKNWSVGLNWTYGWWSKDSRHRYWRAYGGDLNVRRWFGSRAEEKPLTGHHLGLYAGVVTYDFEFGNKGYMGGLPHRTLWDRCNYIAGIEYGYSLPVARRLNIDFTIGIGYMGGKYLEYKPQGNGYMWLRTMRLNWFGPTKAEISLVWLIGCDNYNRSRKKGG